MNWKFGASSLAWCASCGCNMADPRAQLFALVDANNFYASCEKSFQPRLRDRPVVVLSNNDGCVVARSKEVKALGIVKMGQPWFQMQDLARQHGIVGLNRHEFSRHSQAAGNTAFHIRPATSHC